MSAIRYDYHMHSLSPDAGVPMEEMCREAVRKGLLGIAITDHFEFLSGDKEWNPDPDAYWDRYFEELKRCRRMFEGKLLIRSGIELGQPLAEPKLYRYLIEKYPFDFRLASVHKLDNVDLKRITFTPENGLETAEKYYGHLLELSEVGEYDCLSHLDYCKRHMMAAGLPDYFEECRPLIEKILRNVIKRGKGIEINTSGLRHAPKATYPNSRILSLYHNLGGQIITVGSDAHKPEQIASGFEAAETLLREAGFPHTTIFTEGKPENIPL